MPYVAPPEYQSPVLSTALAEAGYIIYHGNDGERSAPGFWWTRTMPGIECGTTFDTEAEAIAEAEQHLLDHPHDAESTDGAPAPA